MIYLLPDESKLGVEGEERGIYILSVHLGTTFAQPYNLEGSRHPS